MWFPQKKKIKSTIKYSGSIRFQNKNVLNDWKFYENFLIKQKDENDLDEKLAP